jgi:hypothetical protein
MALGEDGRREASEGSNEPTRTQNEHDKDSGKFLEGSGVSFRCWGEGGPAERRWGKERGGEKEELAGEETAGQRVVTYIYWRAQYVTSRVMGGLKKEASVVGLVRTGHRWP